MMNLKSMLVMCVAAIGFGAGVVKGMGAVPVTVGR